MECPGSGSVPGVDGFMCSLDGGNFFGCKRVFAMRCFVMDVFCFWFEGPTFVTVLMEVYRMRYTVKIVD